MATRGWISTAYVIVDTDGLVDWFPFEEGDDEDRAAALDQARDRLAGLRRTPEDHDDPTHAP